MKQAVFFVALSFLFASAAGSDAPCVNQGGTCQDDSNACSGSYQSGLCSGAATRRCCVPAHGRSDSACVSQGGSCQQDSGACEGFYQTGLCAGDSHRLCCLTASGTCPHIISRQEWGARSPTHHVGDMAGPAKFVFIHHGSSPACHSESSCKSMVRSYQNYHIDSHGWSDIGYNFVVGEDGNAYMARGWTEIGAHTQHYNSVGIAICVIGDFNSRLPNPAALLKIQELIQCGLDLGHISATYTLKGHRDVGSTDCPGDQLYTHIQSWPHYMSGTQTYA